MNSSPENSTRNNRGAAVREVIGLAAVTLPALYLALHWAALPDTVPIHFGMNGRPDGYGPRSMLWWLAAFSAGQYALLLFVSRLPRIPLNLPFAVSPASRPRVEALARSLLGWMRLELACLFAYLIWCSAHPDPGLGSGFIPITVLVPLLTILVFFLRMRSRVA